jgi:squalene cyclase
MTFALAQQRGFAVDRDVVNDQARAILERWGRQRENLFQGETGDINGGVIGAGYALVGIDAADVPPNSTTDAMVHYIAARQLNDGRFRSPNANRAPLEYSDVSATAVAIRALQAYTPPGRAAETSAIVRRAAAWLLAVSPRGTEETSLQVQGLAWAGAERREIERRAAALAAEQRPDGGWAQLPELPSDAYATGQTLVALQQAGHLSARATRYRRGVAFLLDTQRADGSWLVISRSRGTQPYFESGFPHGTNQFISAAGTAWATSALGAISRGYRHGCRPLGTGRPPV